MLVAFAGMGATPLKSRAGKAIKLPPPATALSAPPSTPAKNRKMIVCGAKYQVYHIGTKTHAECCADDLPAFAASDGWGYRMGRFLMVVGGLFLVAQFSFGQNGAPAPNPCSAKEQQQFEFWVGEWDASWPGTQAGTTQHGMNSIHRILDNCVVEENFSGGAEMHLRGRSVSIFDVRAGKWKQTWVDNEGGYLDFVGEFKDGSMILAREFTRPDGAHVMQRMVYKNITANDFDWSWESSNDNGKTWQVQWPIHYQRRK